VTTEQQLLDSIHATRQALWAATHVDEQRIYRDRLVSLTEQHRQMLRS